MKPSDNGASHVPESIAHPTARHAGPTARHHVPAEMPEVVELQHPESLKPLNILFIMPKGKKEEESGQKPLFTMAIGVLVSITPEQHRVELVDELFGDAINYDGDYDLVGITTRTCNANRAYEIADAFRQRGTTVVLGGVHASFNYQEAIAHCDSVVCGEAENLWTTVLQDVAFGTLKPHYDSRDFPPVKQAPKLNYQRIYESGKREKVDSRKSIPIYMTRGCPYNCSFCVTPNFTGKLYRIQSADTIREQVEAAKHAFFKETRFGNRPWLMFTDENFGVNKKKMWEILEVLKEMNVRFSTFISVNFLEDPQTVRLLVEAGCAMALVGFESINQETLKRYSKNQNNAQNYERIIKSCRTAGLNIQGNFLVNPATDSYDDMDATEQFVRNNHLMMPLYTIMTPYPGTRMYWEYKEQGLVVDEDWDKYTAHNLVVKCTGYDPLEYQLQYLRHFLGMYSWDTILNRVLHNRMKLINLVTSLILRKNLQDQIKSIKEGKNTPLMQQESARTEAKEGDVSVEQGQTIHSKVH